MLVNGVKYEVIIEKRADAANGVRLRAVLCKEEHHGGERRTTAVNEGEAGSFKFKWAAQQAHVDSTERNDEIIARALPLVHHATVTASVELRGEGSEQPSTITSEPYLLPPSEVQSPALPVRLTRAANAPTRDLILWTAIRYSTARISYANYSRFLDYVLCGDDEQQPSDRLGTDALFTVGAEEFERQRALREQFRGRDGRSSGRFLAGTEAYRKLAEATDCFLRTHCGVLPPPEDFAAIESDLLSRIGTDLFSASGAHSLKQAWASYAVHRHRGFLLPYFEIVRERLRDMGVPQRHRDDAGNCGGLIQERLEHPCFIELIWSYWQEEGMLVQTFNAVTNRFQNRRSGRGERDPLVNLEIDPLRPLNNLLWGYVQEDYRHLTVPRRAREYEHQYGLGLEGKAVGHLRVADRRSKFLEAFHNFLHRCLRFYQQDDDTTVIADGFPILNAIKEVHYLLAQAAHNQFGDMPSAARQEMLIQQWLLARPEMREFLGARNMVPYPEPWMDRVDNMKALQGWTDASVVHFNDLATFGEQIVLGLRYGAWSLQHDPAAAANFARVWRAEIQSYQCAYRAVTGIDVGAEPTSHHGTVERDLPPSFHLKRRLAARRAV